MCNHPFLCCNSDVDIQLTEDDYRDNEANLNIGFIVSKDARIATDVSLSVTPVVVSEARRLNLFPVNVEQPDNLGGRSPVDAGESTGTYSSICELSHCCLEHNNHYDSTMLHIEAIIPSQRLPWESSKMCF